MLYQKWSSQQEPAETHGRILVVCHREMTEMLRKSHSRPKIEAGTALPHVPCPSRTLARHRIAIIRNLPLGKCYMCEHGGSWYRGKTLRSQICWGAWVA